MPPPQEDRHDPLPGLLSIPGFLVRRLGRRGRIIVGVVGALALACGVAAAVVEIPKINDTKRDNAAEARRDQAAAHELQRRRLIAEQRPQRGASRVFPALTPKRRRAVVGDSTKCEKLPYAPDTPEVGRLSCTAVTSEIRRDGVRAGIVGYPFRALVHYDTGRYAWCKVSGRSGEGSFTRSTKVRVPRGCGGRGHSV